MCFGNLSVSIFSFIFLNFISNQKVNSLTDWLFEGAKLPICVYGLQIMAIVYKQHTYIFFIYYFLTALRLLLCFVGKTNNFPIHKRENTYISQSIVIWQ